MLNLKANPDNSWHYAYRISYTHIEGETKETTLCLGRETDWDMRFKKLRGIVSVDCVGKLAFHNEDCEDRGDATTTLGPVQYRQFNWMRR